MTAAERYGDVSRAEARARAQARAAWIQGLRIANLEAAARTLASHTRSLADDVAELLRGQTT